LYHSLLLGQRNKENGATQRSRLKLDLLTILSPLIHIFFVPAPCFLLETDTQEDLHQYGN